MDGGTAHVDNIGPLGCLQSGIPSLIASGDQLADTQELETNYIPDTITMIDNKQLPDADRDVLNSNILAVLPSAAETSILLGNDEVLCDKVINCNHLDPCPVQLDHTVRTQVFSEVMATISNHFLQMIPENQCSLLEKLQLSANVIYEDKENNGEFVIRGNLQQIVQAQKILETYLGERCLGFCGHQLLSDSSLQEANVDVCKRTTDKAVMCDIIKLDRLSHFALEHPRQARFSSLLLRQTAARVAVKDKYRFHRKVVKHRKMIMASCSDKRLIQSSSAKLATVSKGPSSCPRTQPPVCETPSSPNPVNNESIVKPHSVNTPEKCDFTTLQLSPPQDDKESSLSAPQLEEEESLEEELRRKTRRNYEELTPYKFFCKRCSFKTKRESHYMKHLVIHDKVKTLYNCENCSFTTIRLSHLRRHEMSHSQTTYNCDQCSYKTDEMKLLTRHVKLKHKRDEDPPSPVEILQCTQCQYKTTKPYHFKRHLRVHNSDVKTSSRVYQCDQCTYKTNRKEHYIRHVNNVHSNKRPYLCDFCGKAFKRPDALKQHRITHGGADSRAIQFKCGICQKKCRSQAHLNEHQAVHSNIRSFLCEICGASFKTRSVQRKHIITIHKNPRAHPCEHCDKRFNTNYALRRHLRLHLSSDENLLTPALMQDASSNILLDDSPPPSVSLHEQLIAAAGPTFSEHPVIAAASNTLSLTLQQGHSPSSSTAQLTLSAPINSLPSHESIAGVTEGTTLLTIQEPLDQGSEALRQGPSTFIQTSEATTALLYLTANFTQF